MVLCLIVAPVVVVVVLEHELVDAIAGQAVVGHIFVVVVCAGSDFAAIVVALAVGGNCKCGVDVAYIAAAAEIYTVWILAVSEVWDEIECFVVVVGYYDYLAAAVVVVGMC